MQLQEDHTVDDSITKAEPLGVGLSTLAGMREFKYINQVIRNSNSEA